MAMGIDAVIHTAGFGMTGTSNLPANDHLTIKVNELGTYNVITACRQFSVKAIGIRMSLFAKTMVHCTNLFVCQKVFTSSLNLSHDSPIFDDQYTRSKKLAETMVISAAADCMKTCSLRLGGIYGPGEGWILPRLIQFIKLGILTLFSFSHVTIDFLHIDNCVQAHVKVVSTVCIGSWNPSFEFHLRHLKLFWTNLNLSMVKYLTSAMVKSKPWIPLSCHWRKNFWEPPPSLRFLYLHFCSDCVPISSIISPRSSALASGTEWTMPFPPMIRRYLKKKLNRLPFWGLTPMEVAKVGPYLNLLLLNCTSWFELLQLQIGYGQRPCSIAKAKELLSYSPRVSEVQWVEIFDSFDLTLTNDKKGNRDKDDSSNAPQSQPFHSNKETWYIQR